MKVETRQVFNGDQWPIRDRVCHKSAYDFTGAQKAFDLCKQHRCVLQAGGNVGVWPRWLAERFDEVWTVEPSRENFDCLLENLEGLRNINAIHAALSDTIGECGMIISRDNCGDDRTNVDGGKVRTITIDSMSLEPDLIYLDIQGDELAALRGAAKTIVRSSPVIAIEYSKGHARGDARELLDLLGYKLVDHYQADLIYAL